MGVRVPPELLERITMYTEDIYIILNRIMSYVSVWFLALWYFKDWSIWYAVVTLFLPTICLIVLFIVVLPLMFLFVKGDT